MGKIAKLLNKKKKPKESEFLGSGLIEAPNQPKNSISIATADDFKQYNLKRQRYFACISYERAQATCRWCLTEHRSKYDLTWGNKYTKNAYDSEECKNMDAKSRGIAVVQEGEED